MIKKTRKIIRNNESEVKLYEISNLSPDEYNSIISLRNNQNILIKSADKGGATVLMDKENYIFEANRQLNDGKYYKILTEPIFHQNIPKIKNILNEMKTKDTLMKNNLNFFLGQQPLDIEYFIFYLKFIKINKSGPFPPKMPEGRLDRIGR